ncbi:hypothetical protein [Bradyrhizobium sp. Lot33]
MADNVEVKQRDHASANATPTVESMIPGDIFGRVHRKRVGKTFHRHKQRLTLCLMWRHRRHGCISRHGKDDDTIDRARESGTSGNISDPFDLGGDPELPAHGHRWYRRARIMARGLARAQAVFP